MRLALLIALTVGSSSLAYWAPDHVKLNQQVFCDGKPWGPAGFKRGGRTVTQVLDYARHVLYLARPGVCALDRSDDALTLRGVKFQEVDVFGGDARPGFDTPTDAPNASFTLQEWNAKGGLWEDGFNSFAEATKWGGRRAVNHFHDPLTGEGGYTGLTSSDVATGLPYVDLMRKGISATKWVMNGTSGGGAGKNLWGYPSVGDSFLRAFTEKLIARREAGIANAFRAMGQAEHLVEDNTVPDHTRDLAHPGDGWEEYLTHFRPYLFTKFTDPWAPFPLRLVEQGGIRALWDRDVYSSTPEVTWQSAFDPPGLSEYVNANFFAWNLFKMGDVIIDFSSIPDGPGEPFKRGWHLTLGGAGEVSLGLLSIRTNAVSYPWPKLGDYTPPFYASAPGSLAIPKIAREKIYVSGKNLDGEVWKNYEKPLLAHALGYAQTVVALALQPARAEVAADPGGDPLKMSVRLWNLWKPGDPNAVTWHIESMQLVGVRPDKQTPPPYGDETPIDVPSTADLAPGAVVETDAVTLTWGQRGPYRYDTHSALLVHAHLGSGNTKTPLVFSVPIANGYAFVKQTAGLARNPSYTNDTGNCTTTTCGYRAEVGVYSNPTFQTVSGHIELAASELDIFGRKADPELKQAQKEDVRIAGVALVGYSHEMLHDVVHPVASTLTLSGPGASNLVPGTMRGTFVRPKEAADAADAPIDFIADLVLTDFYFPDLGAPLADAARASGTIYIAVWTTAGAVQLQRLVVWPWRNPATAQTVVTSTMACNRTSDVLNGNLYEDRDGCSHGAMVTNPACGGYTNQHRRMVMLYGDPGYAQTRAVSGGITDYILAFDGSTDIRPTTFMGHAVTLSGDAQLPMECPLAQIQAVFPNGNGELVCSVFGPAGLALFHVENTTGTGQCPALSPLGIPWNAQYTRIWLPGLTDFLKLRMGITTPPAWTFTLTKQ